MAARFSSYSASVSMYRSQIVAYADLDKVYVSLQGESVYSENVVPFYFFVRWVNIYSGYVVIITAPEKV